MNDAKREKLVRFMNDQTMSQAVYDVLLEAYLRSPKEHDTQFLAASRIAIDLLKEAWKDLRAYQTQTQREDKDGGNVGL